MMSEKEKMKQGLLYDANYDDEIIADRKKAKQKCYAYNQCDPLQEERKEELLAALLPEKGERVVIEAPFYCDYGYHIHTGDDVFINHNCVMLDGAKISLGNHVFIAPHCGFHTAFHPLQVKQRNAGLEYAESITIKDNVWIGAGVQVLAGVTIGENSVIGAGSTVLSDIPANVVAAGTPCRVIRELTEEERSLS